MDDFEEDYYDENDDSTSVEDVKEIYDKSKEFHDRTQQLKTNNTKQGAQQGAKEGTKQVAKEGSKEAAKEGTKQAAKEGTKQVAKEGGKVAAKEGVKAGVGAGVKVGTRAIPVLGWILLGIDVIVGIGKLVKKEINKRKNENEQQKGERKIKEAIPLIIILSILLLPIIISMGVFSIGVTVTTHDSVERVYDFVDCMESKETCSDVTGLELEEEIQGYDKPLILFNKAEYKEVAEKYVEFSEKYFELGEGLFNDDYEEVKENFGTSEELEKSEIDAAVLANFMTLEARAFAGINWIEVTYDEKTNQVVKKPVTEFDIIYDSSKDTSTGDFFSWFNKDKEYILKIPSVEKYNVRKTKSKVIAHIVNGEEGGRVGEVVETEYPAKKDITEEYKKKVFLQYVENYKDVLAQWYEPYLIYLNDGDVESAKETFDMYVDLYNDKDHRITVELYKTEKEYNETRTTTTDITTNIKNEEPSTDKIVETIVTNVFTEGYMPSLYRGLGTERFLKEMYISNYRKDYSPDLKYAEYDALPFTTKIYNDKREEIGSSTVDKFETVTTETVYSLPPNKVEYENFSYSYNELINDTGFSGEVAESLRQEGKADATAGNKYYDARLAYIYSLVCSKRGVEFDIDAIGAALEVVQMYYKKTKGISSDGTNDSIFQDGNVGGTYSEPVESGKVDKDKGGWDSTFTSSSGKTYREYKQDLGYYKDYDYAGYGPFSSWACPMVATSIFLEGYGIYVDPYELYKVTGALNPAMAANKYLGKSVAMSSTYTKQKTIDLLKSGKPVAIHNTGWNSAGHYMTILDYDPVTDRVYLSEVHTGYNGRTDNGWIDIDKLNIDTIYYIP